MAKKNCYKKRSENKEFNKNDIIENKIFDFEIKNIKLTEKQKKLAKIVSNEKTKLIFINGPAGTAKTFCSMFFALKALKKKQVDEIIYVRTAIEVGKSLGHMPGDLEEKFNYYTCPLHQKLEEFLEYDDIKNFNSLHLIKSYPINFLRGSNFENKFVILDEAQNCDHHELKTFLTRFTDSCQIMVIGDDTQSDIGKKSCLKNTLRYFNDIDSEEMGIYCFNFEEEDIMRGELCKFITKKFNLISQENQKNIEKSSKKYITKTEETWTPSGNS